MSWDPIREDGSSVDRDWKVRSLKRHGYKGIPCGVHHHLRGGPGIGLLSMVSHTTDARWTFAHSVPASFVLYGRRHITDWKSLPGCWRLPWYS